MSVNKAAARSIPSRAGTAPEGAAAAGRETTGAGRAAAADRPAAERLEASRTGGSRAAATAEKAAAAVGASRPAAARRSAAWTIGKAAAKALRGSAAIAALALVWETAPRLGLVDATFLPPLSEVLRAWGELAVSGSLLENFQASIVRSVSGLLLAVAIAIPLGLAIGYSRTAALLLGPVLELFRNTAALALLPVFILILGIGETSKISIVLFACTWPILLNTVSGVRGVDPLLVKSARSLGLPPFQLFWKVILPASLPSVFTGIRLAGASSILVLIAAEMVGAKAGLGYLINYTQYNFQIPEMYAGILTISALGLLINHGLVLLERRFSGWKANAER
ncbi:ABC transporter permease [Paenibacillus sp. B01]|uniref:ABC transporter permease n=1 Tax=Paenibacillus sp. B01 TaxID=2660554 RepID=UPI00129AAF98|nr:ABC transporter permease [Paenibacillus sp. B01]QGG54645.1 ABC transporter permease subunit [Paenibacillus sp. B01]